MSQFYSDLITWSVVGLASGAIVLGNLPSEPSPAPVPIAATETETVFLAAAEPTTLTDATEVVAVSMVEPVSESRNPLPQVIEDAVLVEVSFTSTGDDLGLPVVAEAPTGVVTGQSVNLRAGPGTSYQIVSRAVRNDELVVTGETNGIWVQVLAPISEVEAWIHGNYFDAPDPA